MDTDTAAWAPLLDVSQLPVAELRNQADTTLARALDRLRRELADPNGTISAFGSFVGDN